MKHVHPWVTDPRFSIFAWIGKDNTCS